MIAGDEYGIVEAKPKMMFYNLPGYSFSEIVGINFKLYDKDVHRIIYKSIDRACSVNVIYNGIDWITGNSNTMEMLYKTIETDLALDELG